MPFIDPKKKEDELILSYADFLAGRRRIPRPASIPVADLPNGLFDFQQDLVEWACDQGRSAIFADCGLGKTAMQLAWASNVARHTSRPVLILAPLAVADQTVREGEKFGIQVSHQRLPAPAEIVVTNYERLSHFEHGSWGGVVLDESSILKSFDGKTRDRLIEFGRNVEYRLCCTATPSPNDHEELGGHCAFLGVLSQKQMLAEFFVNDGLSAAHWRLKGHGARPFWRWVAEWARTLRSPGDLGYPDDGFQIPSLNLHVTQIEADSVSDDRLFAVPVSTMSERRQARRESITERVAVAVDRVAADPDEPWIVWCDLNDESRMLSQAIPGAVEVTGSDPAEIKEERLRAFSAGEIRVLVSKPSIAGWGLNWQHCARVLFVGLSDSYEQYYQAIRRCWRFGQTRSVNVEIIASNREQAVLENIQRKQRQADEFFKLLVAAMKEEIVV